MGWGMRSSYFIRILVKQLQAISETMTDQIVLEVQIALMTDLSADRSTSLVNILQTKHIYSVTWSLLGKYCQAHLQLQLQL